MDEAWIGILIIAFAICFILFLLCLCCRKCKAKAASGGNNYGPNVPVISEPSHYDPSKYDIETGYHPHPYKPAPPVYQPPPQHVGNAVWSVALKKNGNPMNKTPSSKAWYVSSGRNLMSETEDIMDWVHHVLDGQQWEGFFAYNDQPPGHQRAPSSRGAGHCKGIVAWNRHYLGWLVHSVPRWPDGRHVSLSRQNYSFPSIEPSQLIFAQSFAWVVMPVSSRSSIINQLLEMQAYVFFSSPNSIWPRQVGEEVGARDSNGHSVPRTLPLGGSEVYHIAKNGGWDACIYHDFLGTGLGKGTPMPWRVQTWSKQSDLKGLQFYYVMDVRRIQFPDHPTSILNGSAHSKWAISHDPHHALVFIGDLNRALSQNKRGGGGILIKSRVLWNFMDSLCVSYFQSGISYEQ